MKQGRNDGGQQRGQQGEQQGGQNICSSPRLHEKMKADHLERLHERRKMLRLPTQPSNSEQEHEEENDVDIVPHGEGSRDDDGAAGDDDVVVAAAGDGDKVKSKPQSMRCSPVKFIKLLNALPNDMKGQVVAKRFGGLLNFKPDYLRRDVSSWLMWKSSIQRR
jgi:hypothetical protein